MYFAHKLEVTCRKLNLNNQFKGSWPKSQKSTKKQKVKRCRNGVRCDRGMSNGLTIFFIYKIKVYKRAECKKVVLSVTGERQTVWQPVCTLIAVQTLHTGRQFFLFREFNQKLLQRSFVLRNSLQEMVMVSAEGWRPHSSRAHRSHQQRQHRRWCTF